jgi:tRNA-specific 2-thiouridylase
MFEDLAALRGQRVAVAMSGGVDSSVVAALAHEAGYEVVGLTLQLHRAAGIGGGGSGCCGGSDIRDARLVAETLGFPHYVIDAEARFAATVLRPFADSYAAGQTPVPCVDCNRSLKFVDLLDIAATMGAEALLTGHYARRVEGPDGPELHRAADPAKDQSYYLWATTPAQLERLRFPLGGLEKAAVRREAQRFGLGVAAKPDSVGLCFAPDGNYAAAVERLRPEPGQPGEIVDRSGRVLGRHHGIHYFTVGQRRGIDIGGQPEPLYVVAIDAATARVIVGPRAELAVTGVTIDEINRLVAADTEPGDLTVKVRSLAAPAAAAWRGDAIRFAEPQYGVAPGQAAVIYAGTRLVGGGRIVATDALVLPQAA